MKIDSLVSKLDLKEQWIELQQNPNTLLLEHLLLEIVKHLESKGLVVLDPMGRGIMAYYDDFLKPIYQIFKKVSPTYGLDSKNPIVVDLCYEASLSLEKKMTRAARLWGWQSLDQILDCMEGRATTPNPTLSNLEFTLSALDDFLKNESLVRCLLSDSSFIRKRKLDLKNKKKSEKKKASHCKGSV